MIKDSRFIPFNSETALVHAFFSVSENQYGRCVPTKTIKTSANIATPTEKQSTTFKMAQIEEETDSVQEDSSLVGSFTILKMFLSVTPSNANSYSHRVDCGRCRGSGFRTNHDSIVDSCMRCAQTEAKATSGTHNSATRNTTTCITFK